MHTENIEYRDSDTVLEGFLATPSGDQSPRPVVLIAHAWGGRDEFVCNKAEIIAEKLNYAAFALDMYGKNVRGSNPQENSQLMMPFMSNRALLRDRITAAFKTVKNLNNVDHTKIAGIGFCFGGLCILDLARSGADLQGVISFHGLLQPPDFLPNQKIKAKILACHGFDDPMVPPEQVLHFQREMTDAKADWQMHIYGNTMHAFTNPQANDRDFGTVYNTLADHRSWQAMVNFLNELFA